MTEVAVYGSGGLGRVVRDILLAGNRYRVAAFLDSEATKHGTVLDGLRVHGGVEAVHQLLSAGTLGVVVAIGDNQARVAIAEQLRQRRVALVSAIHPSATITPSAQLGEHVIAGARTTICAHAVIGPHCVLSTGAIVDHDNSLGKGVFLHPAVRLAGGVTIEDYATLGIGSCVIPYRRIGQGAYVEPGSVVIRDVQPGTTVGGVPARQRPHARSRFVPDPLPGLQHQPV